MLVLTSDGGGFEGYQELFSLIETESSIFLFSRVCFIRTVFSGISCAKLTFLILEGADIILVARATVYPVV